MSGPVVTTHPHPSVTLHHADVLDALRLLPDASVDSVVTDPPYAISFMGRDWDTMPPREFQAWCESWARECLRVLRPGGHLLAFGGTRTWHRLAAGVEDAGFEVRDSLAWLYATGFPKALDVGKAIDACLGADREVVGAGSSLCSYLARSLPCAGHGDGGKSMSGETIHAPATAPATPEAAAWDGWGTALKPGFEPAVVARKPFLGSVAANVLAHGTGAMNIGATRTPGTRPDTTRGASVKASSMRGPLGGQGRIDDGSGRYPTNVLLDEHAAARLDAEIGYTRDGVAVKHNGVVGGVYSPSSPPGTPDSGYGGAGGPSRFFPTFRYQAKAPTSERPVAPDGTAHVSVKPLALIEWMLRLVTPSGGTVLEPFAGSGTTVEAALREGFAVVAVEREASYLPLIEARVASFVSGASRRADRVARPRPRYGEDDLFAECLS